METKDINKPVPVMLPTRHWSALRLEGVETGRSASAIVRELVAAHLRRKSRADTRRAVDTPPAA